MQGFTLAAKTDAEKQIFDVKMNKVKDHEIYVKGTGSR